MELCRDKVFYVAIECGLDQRIYVATEKIILQQSRPR